MKNVITRFKQDQKGNMLFMFAIMLTVLISVVMLSIDVGKAALVKSKVQQATDSAALSAALMPSGTTQVQRDNMAQKYFRNNFPDNYLDSGIESGSLMISYSPSADNPTSVSISHSGEVKSSMESSRRINVAGKTEVSTDPQTSTEAPVDIIFVLDFSSSMKGKRAQQLKNSMYQFSNHIYSQPNATQIYQTGIVPFAKKVLTELPLTNSAGAFNKAVSRLINGSGSHIYRGLERARFRLAAAPVGSAVYDAPGHPRSNGRKIVIVETDGGSEGGDIVGLCKSMHDEGITIFTVMIKNYSYSGWWYACAGDGKPGTDKTKYVKPGGSEAEMTAAFIGAMNVTGSGKMRIAK